MFKDELLFFVVMLGIFLIILFLIFLYLVMKKIRETKKRESIEAYKEELQLPLFHFLREGVEEVEVGRDPLQVRALIELMAGFSQTFASEDILMRIRLFAEDHFDGEIKKHLRHRRWSMRMNGLYWIEDFGMRTMKTELDRVYQSRKLTKQEEIQILKIHIKNGSLDVMKAFMHPKHEFTEFEYSLLFQALENEDFEGLMEVAGELPEVMHHSLIDSIGMRQNPRYAGFLEEKLGSASSEIRIRALKAIVAMEHYLPPDLLAEHLESESWQERLMAIKVCEYVRNPELTGLLISLMRDASFYVRSQAAQAIMRLERGQEILKEMAVSEEDLYARDMAEQWLERGRIT